MLQRTYSLHTEEIHALKITGFAMGRLIFFSIGLLKIRFPFPRNSHFISRWLWITTDEASDRKFSNSIFIIRSKRLNFAGTHPPRYWRKLKLKRPNFDRWIVKSCRKYWIGSQHQQTYIWQESRYFVYRLRRCRDVADKSSGNAKHRQSNKLATHHLYGNAMVMCLVRARACIS